ncbi:hypothetical protein GUITHDRAFT_154379 [Guillardia theta CCMP2712]|uniref:Uncharacterized protein n=2 Tax=Guillardia theta TaxID=55529 RepID=L1IUQ0_GUITC|nr:hypothetical protein GUITHDRAFT_154379 [Guillardia theta CCMP2712]EKX39570.1 hypothetical protein GUITHDRAFT_154379 [Guillardia theta CCMP2712]|eukprot:XP_005826550.1 hypothetical protein GUITHDRAFT_154379 [Guillardia theta CCMP2712]
MEPDAYSATCSSKKASISFNRLTSSLRSLPSIHDEASSAFNNYSPSHASSASKLVTPVRTKAPSFKHGKQTKIKHFHPITINKHSAKDNSTSTSLFSFSIDHVLSFLHDDALSVSQCSSLLPSSSITSLTLHGDELKCLPSLIVPSYPDSSVPILAGAIEPTSSSLPPISDYLPMFSHASPSSSSIISKELLQEDLNDAVDGECIVGDPTSEPQNLDHYGSSSKERKKRNWDGAARARHSEVCTGRTRLTLIEKAEIIKLYYTSTRTSSFHLDQKTLARMYNKSPAAISKILKPNYAIWILSKCVRILSTQEISDLSFIIRQAILAGKGG